MPIFLFKEANFSLTNLESDEAFLLRCRFTECGVFLTSQLDPLISLTVQCKKTYFTVN